MSDDLYIKNKITGEFELVTPSKLESASLLSSASPSSTSPPPTTSKRSKGYILIISSFILVALLTIFLNSSPGFSSSSSSSTSSPSAITKPHKSPPPKSPPSPSTNSAYGTARISGLLPPTPLFPFYDSYSSSPGEGLGSNKNKSHRPSPPYSSYPSGDVPGGDFPPGSWQADPVYVNHFLDSALGYVRAVKASIVEEYSSADNGNDASALFAVSVLDLPTVLSLTNGNLAGALSSGGALSSSAAYVEEKSYAGLSRRMIHALMTNSPFVVTLGGHSSAAGHGNNFNQSYTSVVGSVLGPVFERLGMTFVARNAAMGGLGTSHSSRCGGDVYGHDNDVVVWDSMMTEAGGLASVDQFYRQALLR